MSKNLPFLREQQKPGMPGAVLVWVPSPGPLRGWCGLCLEEGGISTVRGWFVSAMPYSLF